MTSRQPKQSRGPQQATRTPSPIQSGPFNPPPSGQDWELAINGDLTDKQNELITSLVEVPRRSRGIVWFDSGGGSVYVGLALCSIIRLRGLRVTGVVAGECSSAAILPFAACERRFVTAQSTLLFHPMRWQSAEDVRLEEATEWARHFKNLERDLDKLLARLFDFPETKISEWTNPGQFISGQELVDAGLAKLIDMFDGDLWSQMSRQ
ncbi:MAG: ClpP family protease [Planctomycetales bacterium]|jgi:ATP-dependent Clp protease protease subunit